MQKRGVCLQKDHLVDRTYLENIWLPSCNQGATNKFCLRLRSLEGSEENFVTENSTQFYSTDKETSKTEYIPDHNYEKM